MPSWPGLEPKRGLLDPDGVANDADLRVAPVRLRGVVPSEFPSLPGFAATGDSPFSAAWPWGRHLRWGLVHFPQRRVEVLE